MVVTTLLPNGFTAPVTINAEYSGITVAKEMVIGLQQEIFAKILVFIQRTKVNKKLYSS